MCFTVYTSFALMITIICHLVFPTVATFALQMENNYSQPFGKCKQHLQCRSKFQYQLCWKKCHLCRCTNWTYFAYFTEGLSSVKWQSADWGRRTLCFCCFWKCIFKSKDNKSVACDGVWNEEAKASLFYIFCLMFQFHVRFIIIIRYVIFKYELI